MHDSPIATAAPERPRRRSWLPRILAVVVLVGATLALTRLDVFGGPAEPTAAERTATISAELKQKMNTILEQLPLSGHAGHGGNAANAAKATTLCGSRVFGYEPEDAKSVAEVKTLYGYHMCAMAEPEMPWDFAPKLVAPLVMQLDQQPPAIRMAESTETMSYQESLRQIIPPRYQEQAVQGALEPETMADLRRRFDAVSAG